MNKDQHHPFLFIVLTFSISIMLLFACTADDDDDDSSDPTATPIATHTATSTPTQTFTPTPTPEPATGTLNIWTSPVSGDIFVDGEFMANGSWADDVVVGDYSVSFGDVAGYDTPVDILATVVENATTDVEGVYVSNTPPTITNFRVNGVSIADQGEYDADQYDNLSITATLSDNTDNWWFEWTFNPINPPNGSGGGNITAGMYYSYAGFDNCALHASNSYGTTDYYFVIK